MYTDVISELQALFRYAALLRAQDMLASNPDMECQLLIRFANGTQIPLLIKREEINSILSVEKKRLEETIDNILNTQEENNEQETNNQIE